MIVSLSIVNYALIENLEIDFESGFSVITGETGAGKSIIIGALSLILGSRANLSVLKDPKRKCVIEGVFENDNLQLKDFFKDNDLDYEKQTIIRRELLPSGKSRAFINDTPVSLKLINYLGNVFVNIHSQHHTLNLADASFQLDVLDDFSNNSDLVNEYQSLFSDFKKLQNKLEDLIRINESASRDEDYYKFLFNELVDVNLNTESFAELEEKVTLLEHSEEIKLALSEAENLINNNEDSLVSVHSKLIKSLVSVVKYLPKATELVERLKSLLIELEDVGNEISQLNSYEDYDPEELQYINDQLSHIYSLFKKHHLGSMEELMKLRDEFENKLQSIQNVESDIQKVKSELLKFEESLNRKADRIHKLREEGGSSFALSVIEVLKQLGMKDASFNVIVEKQSSLNIKGIDKVQFMFNANLGAKSGEISKIASGGELSRLMLAIKSLINQKQMMPTVVFDEIDSGVSGDIAGKVAKILKNMSQIHQVISITHLPQIASKADHHFKVAKAISNNTTITIMHKLDKNGRVEELATMLSSENVTETAKNVAKEMIQE